VIRHWVDGVAGAPLDPGDRGLHYGDGLFETLAVADGRPRHLDRHLARLKDGLARLGIPADPAPWTPELLSAAAQAPEGRGVLKLVVTRGSGGRGYAPPDAPVPRRFLFLHPWPTGVEAGRRAGVAVRWCRTRLGEQPALAGLKHLNRLEQVLARSEWRDPAIAEGLLCDGAGRVVEGTRSNLFLVRDGVLLTPRLDRCGVAGVMRGLLLETAAALGLEVRVTDLRPDDVEGADELFLSNSVIGLWPVRCLEGRTYPAPGPLTRRLQEALGLAP